MKRFSLVLASLAMLLALMPGCSSDPADDPHEAGKQPQRRYLAFGGGPTGGTFNFFANKMAGIISASHPRLEVSARGAGGSAENLRSLDADVIDLGIVYSGDAFLGRRGELPDDPARHENVRALSFLYGAPAQLVVRADSGITSASQMAGMAVAVGNPGSGAALCAERFFGHLGLWDSLDVHKVGYAQAAADFSNGIIDAFWVLVGYPNIAITEAAALVPLRLLDLHFEAVESGFYEAYPFYGEVVVPAGTYAGQDRDVTTFQDASLWCASAALDGQTVYDCLKAVYSPQGLGEMRAAHSAARDMGLERALDGVSVSLHPGAVRFWAEQGLDIPERLRP
ncbi:TAXI family TRAP transporter solute-binding subunit [Pseudodesulfovibrio sp. F-1]|uniref:TAXI family TRAP transporter solute-binding subunit n=1 Tax=Pseudodesulfovibrio alkaliphilus TaxID=2661613 RepID=A0A7K1KKL0_9BACT|nr:TAXI family TRAP transporter solute-binding subunit [Pseudodesulfovibrio alkaliphilus]MUM76580.1 TAXI family TRAP transporter solute-binding subunit [Pseudodesulfovibrio alkaliphilus]